MKNENLLKNCVSEIRVNQIHVNQGVSEEVGTSLNVNIVKQDFLQARISKVIFS
jgi:hypothetical protein